MLSDHGVTEFTTISLSQNTPASSDRRDGPRYMTVLQAGKLITQNFQELCLIRNISGAGMMAEIFVPLTEGETVDIEFKAGVRVSGVVRWIDDARAGIEFSEPIDVHKVLAPDSGRLSPRQPRLTIEGVAEIEIGEEHFSLPVFDISQGGVKVAHSGQLETGVDLIVAIKGLPVRNSYVRWADENYAGISFNRLMPLAQIAYWAAQQQPQLGIAPIADMGPDAMRH